jgi:nucleotide-binding universal stress UspA family protein
LTKFSRVLAAVDFSKPARSAFEYALALSKHHGAELVVVQAVPLDEAFGWHAADRRALAAELRQRAKESKVAFKDSVQQGDPADVILLHARSLRPDVIVAGSHQRSGIQRMRLGSVGEDIAAKATVPVLLIPHRRTGAIRPFRHVAVAVDFSPGSRRAVEHALALAANPGDRVTLLHVVPGFSSGVPPHLHRYGVGEYDDQLLRDARRRLQLAVPMARSTNAAIHARVLVGDTTTEISRVVDNIGADLLVVGAPKRNVLSRVLFGTTAARLLRETRVPLLAVPDGAAVSGHHESTALPLAA